MTAAEIAALTAGMRLVPFPLAMPAFYIPHWRATRAEPGDRAGPADVMRWTARLCICKACVNGGYGEEVRQ